MSDDRVGWDSVDPEFVRNVVRNRDRARELLGRLRELTSREDAPARVRIWQEIRDLDLVHPEITFYMIASELAQIASARYMGRFEREIQPRLQVLYATHGIDPTDFDAIEAWNPDPAPEELLRLNQEIQAIEEAESSAVYLEFGEKAMAELEQSNRAEFQRRWKLGQDLVLGPDFFETMMQSIQNRRPGENG
ncbi:MAG TPA: hypothetical protein VEQ60_15810 [Longimicrobium sp.]|nr:hypothetical protein [Longimicrobium sp.]